MTASTLHVSLHPARNGTVARLLSLPLVLQYWYMASFFLGAVMYGGTASFVIMIGTDKSPP